MVACTSGASVPLDALSKQFSSESSFPFRLSRARASSDRVSVISSDQQSVYKQRIDAMFDDSRSSLYGHTPSRRSSSVNFVQDRIEKMFQEVSTSSSEDERPLSHATTAKENFLVHYLGKVPLDDKDTTLQKLQQPLRQLYFGQEQRDPDGAGSRLEISTQGLRLVAPSGGGVSVSHAFSAIAVWAAVKCVARDDGRSCAFLPLIADPDGQDKSALFETLHEQRHVDAARGAHSPLLAVIMRQRGATRQLFCHAFECACAEDAIVMAANLYQALMVNMKGKHNNQSKSNAPAHPVAVASEAKTAVRNVMRARPPPPPHEKLLTTSSDNTDEEQPVASAAPLRTILNNKTAARSRRVSVDPAAGDILTKITIPKSRSFLVRSGGGGSSLHELFAELRTQEGVSNMDEVLEKIVNANGMSYNDLKPLYKELLLKLAVTLTKDELYLRSKNIMKRQAKQSRMRGRRKRGLRHAFRKSVKKIKVTCQKGVRDDELSNLVARRRPRSGSTSSSCQSHPVARGKGKGADVVETRLTNIAKREMRRQAHNLVGKGDDTGTRVRESSSGYVSCSDCSLTSCQCDTDSCLDSDKCYCSLQNTKKQGVSSSSWRHHLNKPPSTQTSRSLQMLLQQPITRSRRPSFYSSRMNVYDLLPGSASVCSRPSTARQRFHSVDNLALDYELFRHNAGRHGMRSGSHQQVLVVSARDNRGRLIYGGESARPRPRRSSSSAACEALSVKKTTEIASLFSNMKLSQTTNVRGFEDDAAATHNDVVYHTLEPPQQQQPVPGGRRSSYALENSLGYLP